MPLFVTKSKNTETEDKKVIQNCLIQRDIAKISLSGFRH